MSGDNIKRIHYVGPKRRKGLCGTLGEHATTTDGNGVTCRRCLAVLLKRPRPAFCVYNGGCLHLECGTTNKCAGYRAP